MSIAASIPHIPVAAKHRHPVAIEIQTFGFWIYIMSDLVLFSALFATYGVLRHNCAGGPTGRDLFNVPSVFVETMLLLVSSATCGFAMLNMRSRKTNRILLWLGVTFLLGLGFVAMEVTEFHHLILEGHGPSHSAFLSAFFTLVSTHGAHVTAGLIWIAVMIVQVVTKGISSPVQSRLLRLSVFWHFLDIIWVGVFTLVYLRGVLA
jgi:cytochrome o ubiquinol oxidase subunit 3